MGFLGFKNDILGIDPGSSFLRVIKHGNLIYNNESQLPSKGNDSINDDQNRDSPPISYTISNFHLFEHLLRFAIKQGKNTKSFFQKPINMYFCIPSFATEVDKRAYKDSGEHAGAVEVYFIDQCYTSAIGMRILFEKKDFIIIDISTSKIEISFFSDSLIIAQGIIKIGTQKLFQLIKNYIFHNYQATVNDIEIEEILNSLNLKQIPTQGINISCDSIKELLNHYFIIVNDEIEETIKQINRHPKLDSIKRKGTFYTGGGARFEYLTNQISIKDASNNTVSKSPLLDNINGLKEIINNREKYKEYITP